MRVARFVLMASGAILFLTLLIRIGPATVFASLSTLSWRLLLLCFFPFSIMTLFDTLGWRFAFRRDRVPFQTLISARLAGEAFNLTTPTASIGGEAVKAWLLRNHASIDESLPSVIIAKTTITVAQGLFLLLGITLAWSFLPQESGLLHGMLWLLAVEVVAVGGFVMVQMAGAMKRIEQLASMLGLSWLTRKIQTLLHVDHALSDFYRNRPRRLFFSIGAHFVGWLLGGFEGYLILRFLGMPVSIVTATVIEACSTAIRFATFFVPGSLGVLEGGQMAVFGALGLGASTGLSFTLVRRIREATWVGIGFAVLWVTRSELKSLPATRLEEEASCAE